MKKIVENDNVIITLPEEVLGGDQVLEFSELIDESLDSGCKVIIANLEDVKVINSSGLGMLVGAHTSCTKVDSQLIIAAPNDKVKELLNITNLSKVLKVEDDVESAKNSES